MPAVVTYRQFADECDKETWHGMSTAFRNGIKCAVQGGECNYTRIDFAEAWFRGFELATKFIEDGNTIRIRFDYQMWKTMQRTIDDLTRERDELKQRVNHLEQRCQTAEQGFVNLYDGMFARERA